MKYPLIFLTLLFGIHCDLFSQNNQTTDTPEKVLQIQTNEKGDAFYLLQKPIGIDSLRFGRQKLVYLLYIKCSLNQGKSSSEIILDTTIGDDWGFAYSGLCPLFNKTLGGSLYPPHICFLDKDNGFVYGERHGYGIFPYILATRNGGVSWEFKDTLPFNDVSFKKEYFSMMRPPMGIFFIRVSDDLAKNMIGYYLTNNAGREWKKRTLKIHPPTLFHAIDFDVQYSANGIVTLNVLLQNKDKFPVTKYIILQSHDYGESFIEYK